MISVIIPALNEEDVIEYCLQSLENQNYKNFEIIVVDGGSKDRTVEIAEKYARVIKQKSKTIGGARKEGTLAAKGDILAFTDADTIFDPNWLSSIEKSMKKFNAATGPVYFYENTFNASVLEFWRKSYAPQRLVGFYRIIGSNMAIRKDTYKKIDGHSDISLLEDYDMSEKLFKTRGVKCTYNKNQIVYTSARRLEKLLPYLWVYLCGQYNYHVVQDRKKLKKYSLRS